MISNYYFAFVEFLLNLANSCKLFKHTVISQCVTLAVTLNVGSSFLEAVFPATIEPMGNWAGLVEIFRIDQKITMSMNTMKTL